MEAKQKAVELVEKFEKYSHSNTKWDDELFNKVLTRNAKKCAIIAVDEIIELVSSDDSILITELQWWLQVKAEIEQLT
jgi:hypothetical protein